MIIYLLMIKMRIFDSLAGPVFSMFQKNAPLSSENAVFEKVLRKDVEKGGSEAKIGLPTRINLPN